MSSEVTVTTHPDRDSLATAVARQLLWRLAEIQAEGRVPDVGLTGGSIADLVHRELARLAPESEVDWRRVEVFWGDERFVPADDADRNAGQARAALLDHVDVDPGRVHEVPADMGQGVGAAATAYAETVRSRGAGSFDVLMLGVGPDGHIASLFPGYPQLDVDDRIAVAVEDSPKPPPQRVSLTFPALNRSREIWFVVSGAEKAEAVARALADDADLHQTPAAGVRGSERTRWFLDDAAATPR